MPTPAAADPFGDDMRDEFSDKRPVVDVELPDLLANVLERVEQRCSVAITVHPREWAERPVSVHADPAFPRDRSALCQGFAVPFKLPAVETSNGGEECGHELRQETPPRDAPEKHDFDVVVDRAAVVQHYGERA